MLEKGHVAGVSAAMEHNAVCKELGRRFGGQAVKDMGDGVLMIFDDPLKAVLAAINIRIGIEKFAKSSTKVGLTTGLVEKVKIGALSDVLGSPVDRAARLEALALAGQIIIDRPLFEAIRSSLVDYKGVRVSDPTTQFLPGLGDTEVREVIAGPTRLAPMRAIKGTFWLNEGGRVPVAERVRFFQGAGTEVIEIGIGLTTFADYFHASHRGLFKQPVRELIKRGVSYKCVAIDPDSRMAEIYSGDRDEPSYQTEVETAMMQLRDVKEEFAREGLRGSFEMYTYAHFPYYHAMCVDIGEERPDTKGRIAVSNYMFATKRADCPVMRFSANSNPRLFETYWNSVRALLRTCRRRW